MTADIISLEERREALLDERWDAYIAAHRRATQTLAIEDGKAAARAWRDWLDLWMTESQRKWIGGKDAV